MSDDAPPEPDRLGDAPHPRETEHLFGQGAAEQTFLDAFITGRLHHAWLITGPRGVGKATLAWRLARFLLATPPPGAEEAGLFGAPEPPSSLDVSPDHPVARRLHALSEPRLLLLRRPWDGKSLKTEITVQEARKLTPFFGMSAADGGHRVVIIDAADELNASAANAVLKLLEEPPQNAVLLLVCHQPSRLLPTIRSRCRTLRCQPLEADDLGKALAAQDVDDGTFGAGLATLAAGSVGAAVSLSRAGGQEIYERLCGVLGSLPRLDRGKAIALADWAGARGEDTRRDLVIRLMDLFLARLARTGVAGPPGTEATPGEAAILTRLSPDPHAARLWAMAQQELGDTLRRGLSANLDPSALILDTFLALDARAQALGPAESSP